MYSMLVVDDNPSDRNGIGRAIPWEDIGVKVAGLCANGGIALKMMEAAPADIVLTDISMPVMNGIELATAIKESYPRTKIIFMSCHDEFDFAKSAIDLDIEGYILKPIKPEELLQTVGKVAKNIREQDSYALEKARMLSKLNDMQPILIEQFLRELLLGNFHDAEGIKNRLDFLYLQPLEGTHPQVISLCIDEAAPPPGGENVADSLVNGFAIKELITHASEPGLRLYPIQVSPREFAAIAFWDGGAQESRLLDLCIGLYTDIREKLALHCKIGISRVNETISGINALYWQASSAARTTFYSEGNPIILFDLIDEQTKIPNQLDNQALHKTVSGLLASLREEDIHAFIEQYLPYDEALLSESYVKNLTFSTVNLCMVLLTDCGHSFADIFGEEYIVWNKLARFHTIPAVRQWLYNFMMAIREYINDKRNGKNAQLITNIKQVVSKRYSEQLSVADIANEIFLSPGYANIVFKKETGQTIFDYLIDVRIDNAKKLLREPDAKVSVVAERVGYINTSYFCLMFKKCVGISPAEYRNAQG